MRVNYKFVGLIPVFGFMCGCSMHRGVITHIDDKKITVKDIDLAKEKTIVRDTTKALSPYSQYVYAGDTVYIESMQYNKDTLYVKDKTRLKINCCLVKSRQDADTVKFVNPQHVNQNFLTDMMEASVQR